MTAGVVLAFLRGQQAALHHGVDLRRHRMIGVQPHDLAGRHQVEWRIADADPADLVAAHLGRHERCAHAGQRHLFGCRPADRVIGFLQAILKPAALLHGMDEGIDHELAGDRATGMAAHAVGDHGQERTVTERP